MTIRKQFSHSTFDASNTAVVAPSRNLPDGAAENREFKIGKPELWEARWRNVMNTNVFFKILY
jgi:hypothetical protein